MKHEPENSVVHLPRSGIKPPPTRIMQHVSSPNASGAVLLSQRKATVSVAVPRTANIPVSLRPADLTLQSFSVTRARTHAHAHARKDEGALRRVLDAALTGGDVRIAALKPSSTLTRFFAWLLIPAMLITPLVPAYANEAPLADRVASDVAAIVADSAIAESVTEPAGAVAAVAEVAEADAPSATTGEVQVDTPPSIPGNETPLSEETTGESSGTSGDVVSPSTPDTPATGEVVTVGEDQVPSSGGASADAGAPAATNTPSEVIPADSDSSVNTPSEVIVSDNDSSATTSTTTIPVDDSTQTDSMASTTEDGVTPIFDIAPDEVMSNVDAIRARLRNEMRGQLRDEVRNEVKQEVRREVEEEVYRGCKNLDGTGYYCIPDAKSFGSPVIENERSIEVVVQPDPITGNKQIFLVRGASTIQLTHGTDDNVFPVLDPLSDTLVWQSLQSGRWQVAFAHLSDVGVPKVQYLTSGENNFNPKIYAGRIVWQAWVDGNWEIFTAMPSKDKIPDEALSAEHRAAGVGGDWQVKRITANSAPDMFPTITGETITWQAVDGGVWQVFAYDIATSVAHRVSKPGVKSDSPKVALVWNEEDANGQMRMVGTSVDGSESFDFTALARRIVDNTKGEPKSPVSNTEIVVVTPVAVRTESEASSTPPVN